ncbi:unnamed protein product [Candidula unifasciata]|uniref:G-protein coupled receptors family 1 profile domain-containing protein n=1 Tax=Candidula unifasciata TaxID=100452 RepID=A0A8S4A9Y0_9EUPU|nr:unnamed protein product [Candidula unifasciata]
MDSTFNLTAESEFLAPNVVNKYAHPKDKTYNSRQRYKDQDADSFTDFIHWNLVFIVIPLVSILGIIGNALSLIVISKQGLRKSSNILLFSLAVSDIVFMIGVNGPPKPMYEWGGGGFQYPRETAMALFYLYHFFDSLNWGSGPTSLCIPVLITIERLIAVFFPLKFTSIVTRRRTIIAVIATNVIFYGLQAYVRTWFQFIYIYDSKRNASIGFSTRNSMYVFQNEVSSVIEMFFNSMIILVIFVGSGCIAIGAKIKIAAIKRLKMTSSHGNQISKGDTGISRTTKTLLCLCVFYTFVCAPISLPAFMPGIMVFPVFAEDPNFRSVGVFVYHVYKTVFCFNASCNFIIYVAMSKSFRDTLFQLINTKRKNVSSCSAIISVTRGTDI